MSARPSCVPIWTNCYTAINSSQLAILNYIDTHCHLDGEEFAQDRDEVVQRAREAGCTSIFLPAIDAASCQTVLDTCQRYPNYCYPMLGLHPEEVASDLSRQPSAINPCYR